MSTVAVIKDDRYIEHIAGPGHPESPNRLRIIHDLLEKEFPDLPRIHPRLADHDELALVHDPFYIQTVASTEGKDYSQLDADTGLCARSYEIARLAAGGLLQGVDSLLTSSVNSNPPDPPLKLPSPPPLSPSGRGNKGEGALSSGGQGGLGPQSEIRNPKCIFAFVRPPGHHAEQDRGMGFCIFNNIAIAAEYAKKKHGLKRILIVDWDLHHGNGTQWTFYNDPSVLFFSSHQFPYYPGSGNFDQVGTGQGEGFTVNAPFPVGFGDGEYIHVYNSILKPVALEYRPELVLVSSGFDPYVKDPLGGMEVTGQGFGVLASLVREIADACCGGKVLITLEGGYNPDGLREGVRSVLNAFVKDPQPVIAPAASAAEPVIRKIVSQQKKYWKCLS